MRVKCPAKYSAMLLAVAALAASFAGRLSAQETDTAPNGRGIGTLLHPDKGQQPDGQGKTGGSSKPASITYHNGPVMLGTTNVYYIWYGNWPGLDASANAIVMNLAQNIGGSPYFNINTTYYQAGPTYVSSSVHYAGSYNVTTYPAGAATYATSLGDSDITAIVASVNPTDPNGVYFVLTTPDVNETSGFCTLYCGWHTHASINGFDIKYAFVGNPLRCPAACQAQSPGPNGSGGGDGLANMIAHELDEAVTDPDFTGWFDTNGKENADKCAWTFGTVYKSSNGAKANMKLGALDYLIQQNWVNGKRASCSTQWP